MENNVKKYVLIKFELEEEIYEKLEEKFAGENTNLKDGVIMLCKKYINNELNNKGPQKRPIVKPPVPNPPIDPENKFYKQSWETIQDYVKRLLEALDNENLLSDEMIQQLQNKDYCKRVLGIYYKLLESDPNKIRDAHDHLRYWTERTYKFRDYYVCSQWWKDSFPFYEINIRKWVDSILSKHIKTNN